ncbi:hypothetical protein AWB78_08558 [Caballeronia calidae]|uniref:Uncharacterized protein n=1 Tax=Caballeronia calidae TaxID=1777139 RepID=A0A158EKX2_9BURK|nr:hypothetical protein [Caballeronia calidae]SAL07380.1 hypothetical protein AWB78_08558 [Caballeronia calidae]
MMNIKFSPVKSPSNIEKREKQDADNKAFLKKRLKGIFDELPTPLNNSTGKAGFADINEALYKFNTKAPRSDDLPKFTINTKNEGRIDSLKSVDVECNSHELPDNVTGSEYDQRTLREYFTDLTFNDTGYSGALNEKFLLLLDKAPESQKHSILYKLIMHTILDVRTNHSLWGYSEKTKLEVFSKLAKKSADMSQGHRHELLSLMSQGVRAFKDEVLQGKAVKILENYGITPAEHRNVKFV